MKARPGGNATTNGKPANEAQIWATQRRYFEERGIDAWRRNEVPEYVTSNPFVARVYAEIVLAFHRDLAAMDSKSDEPLLLCDIGAGSGRFAFHFLSSLTELCAQAGVSMGAFRYVLTDISEKNIAFWQRHPRFAPFFASGMLDTALLDITEPGGLHLRQSNRTIRGGDLAKPIVGIANYLFDSIQQDLFLFRDGQAFRCRAAIGQGAVDGDEARIGHVPDPAPAPGYAEPELRTIFDEYRRTLVDSHLLFPARTLRGLAGLDALSSAGMLLLSADRGEHRLEALDRQPAPVFARHGSVSLPVNYHSIVRFCENRGGVALLPERPHRSIDVVALLMTPQADRLERTRRAYSRHVQDFGPDDFFAITADARERIPHMSSDDLLAYLKLVGPDAYQFACCLPRLSELSAEFDPATRTALRDFVESLWRNYLPLGEELDLAGGIAHLLYEMDDYAGAALFFRRSIEIYGADTGTLYNLACCEHLLDSPARASALLVELLRHDPDNRDARALLAGIEPV